MVIGVTYLAAQTLSSLGYVDVNWKKVCGCGVRNRESRGSAPLRACLPGMMLSLAGLV